MGTRYHGNRVLPKNKGNYRKHKKGLTKEQAITILFLISTAVGILAGGITAAILLPFAYAERGYWSYGSEWCLIFLAAYAGFSIFNNYIFGGSKSRKERI